MTQPVYFAVARLRGRSGKMQVQFPMEFRFADEAAYLYMDHDATELYDRLDSSIDVYCWHGDSACLEIASDVLAIATGCVAPTWIDLPVDVQRYLRALVEAEDTERCFFDVVNGIE